MFLTQPAASLLANAICSSRDEHPRRCVVDDLLGNLGVEVSEDIVFYGVGKLDGVAADFTVFDVGMAGNREVQDHRNLFLAIGAAKGVLH